MTATKSGTLSGFILKKGKRYPRGCFDPHKEMQDSFLVRRGEKKKSFSGSSHSKGGRKISRNGRAYQR